MFPARYKGTEMFYKSIPPALSVMTQHFLKQTFTSSLSVSQMSWSFRRHIHFTLACFNRIEEIKPVPDLFTNPVDRLQPLLQVPIVPDSDLVFRPTRQEMEQSSLLFEPQNTKGEVFKFLGSWPNPHIMPKWNVPEVAFIGKSNVGKSSLLAAMFAQIPDLKVKVSKKPGHTKLMNVFNVKNLFLLVDMPGYGFNMPDHFETSVEAYLKSRRNLLRVFMLIDATTGPVDFDTIAVEMMQEMAVPIMTFILFDGSVGMTKNDQMYFKRYSDLNLPLCMVLTKIDLARPATLVRSVMSVLKFHDDTRAHSCFPQPFLVSSFNGEGLAFLQAFIAYLCGQQKISSLQSSSVPVTPRGT